MVSPVIVGVIFAGAVSLVLPRILLTRLAGARACPRWLRYAPPVYVRTAATLGTLAAPIAIGLSLSSHSHHFSTYLLWYGLGAAGLATKIHIDARAARDKPASRQQNEPIAEQLRIVANQIEGFADPRRVDEP